MLAALAACGKSERVSFDDDDQPTGTSRPSDVIALVPEPQVDLPGRISVFLRVDNINGTPAADLTGDDFEIYENGSLVSRTESFQRIRSQPQVFRSYMHLILDRSNSVQANNAADVQAGAASFIDVVTAQESNFIKISWFDGSPNLHSIAGHDIGFSNDRTALLAAIAALNDEPPFSTSTNLYGAVIQGIADLDAIDAEADAQGVQYRSLALVTFTDGTHQSGPTPTLSEARAAIDATSAGGIAHSSFTIGVGSEIDPFVLQTLGPHGAVAAADFPVLAQAFEEVGDSVRRLANSFYNLTYCSPKTSGMNQLRVSVAGAPADAESATFEFDATGFGAGCAFLDVRAHGELAAGSARAFLTDAVELANGSVVATGWRGSGCVEPGCTQPATAFVTRFNASPADATDEDARSDGRIDATFGTMGVVTLEPPGFAVSGATSVLHDAANGRLIIGGWTRESIGGGATLASLWTMDEDGQAPPTRIDLPASSAAAEGILDLALLPDGNVIASGFRGDGPRSFAIWRLFPSLTLDTAFGVDGLVVYPSVPEADHGGADALALDGSGRIYAVGEANGGIRAIALNASSGALENSFGGIGMVEAARTIGATTFGALLGDAVCDAMGNLIIGGTLLRPVGASGVGEQPAVWRVLPDGAMDPEFRGSLSSPTYSSGVVTLREGSTNDPGRDFGRDTRIEDITIAPDGSILAAGYRWNDLLNATPPNTDLAMFSFNSEGVLRSDFNFVGFLIDDGASADDSFEYGSVVRVLSSGAIWTLGVSNPTSPVAGVHPDEPTVWVDRDPQRVFAPLANVGE